MNRTRQLGFASFTLLALLAGCSTDSSTAPTAPKADLGDVLKEMSLPGLSGVFTGFMPGAVGSASVPVPTGCAYAGASQSFVCPTVTLSGLTATQSYVLLNSAGSPQSQFDPASTAAVRTNAVIVGTVTEAGSKMSLDQRQQMTMSGLLTGKHLLNGTSTMKMNGTVPKFSGTGVDTIAMSLNMTITDLATPSGATAAGTYPTSGTIASEMVMSMAGPLGSTTLRMVMTFNGTSKVAVTVSGNGINQRCTLDLASSTPSCQ